MSALLAAVRDARELVQAAQVEFLRALRRAREEHTLEEIGNAADMTRQGVKWHLDREETTSNEGV